jgi:hypothetical protein
MMSALFLFVAAKPPFLAPMAVISRKFSKEQSRIVQQSFLTGFNAGAERVQQARKREEALADLANAREYQAKRDDDTRRQQAFLQASREKAAADRAEKLSGDQWSKFQAQQTWQQFRESGRSAREVAEHVLKNPHKASENDQKWAANYLAADGRDQQRFMSGIANTKPGQQPQVKFAEFEAPVLQTMEGSPLYRQQMVSKIANTESQTQARRANLGIQRERLSLAQSAAERTIFGSNAEAQVEYDETAAQIKQFEAGWDPSYGSMATDPDYMKLTGRLAKAKAKVAGAGKKYDLFLSSGGANPDYQKFHGFVKQNVGDPTDPANRKKLLQFSSQAAQTPEHKAFIDSYLLDTIGGTLDDGYDDDDDEEQAWDVNAEGDNETPDGLLMPLFQAPDPYNTPRR